MTIIYDNFRDFLRKFVLKIFVKIIFLLSRESLPTALKLILALITRCTLAAVCSCQNPVFVQNRASTLSFWVRACMIKHHGHKRVRVRSRLTSASDMRYFKKFKNFNITWLKIKCKTEKQLTWRCKTSNFWLSNVILKDIELIRKAIFS